MSVFVLFSIEGGDVVKIAQLANIGGQTRISQPETPVTLQFQGNKFTLSPSQLRQLTTGQPLQLQGTLGNVNPIVTLFPFYSSLFPFWTHLTFLDDLLSVSFFILLSN